MQLFSADATIYFFLNIFFCPWKHENTVLKICSFGPNLFFSVLSTSPKPAQISMFVPWKMLSLQLMEVGQNSRLKSKPWIKTNKQTKLKWIGRPTKLCQGDQFFRSWTKPATELLFNLKSAQSFVLISYQYLFTCPFNNIIFTFST